MSSRKFYAVPEEDLLSRLPKKKKRYSEQGGPSCQLDDLRDDITALGAKVDRIFSVTRDMPFPAGLKVMLHDALRCKLCLESPAKPPIIFAKCCRSILGCEDCVNQLYAEDTLTKTCPHCRAPRGYSETVRMCGLDDLARGLTGVLDLSPAQSPEED